MAISKRLQRQLFPIIVSIFLLGIAAGIALTGYNHNPIDQPLPKDNGNNEKHNQSFLDNNSFNVSGFQSFENLYNNTCNSVNQSQCK